MMKDEQIEISKITIIYLSILPTFAARESRCPLPSSNISFKIERAPKPVALNFEIYSCRLRSSDNDDVRGLLAIEYNTSAHVLT